MKRLSTFLAALAFAAALAGCGGNARPTTFSTDNRPLLKRLVEDLKAKNAKGVENDFKALMNREKKDAEEKAAFEKIKAMVDKGDWAGAQSFAEACLSASSN